MRFITIIVAMVCALFVGSFETRAQTSSEQYEIIFFLSPTCPICKYYCKYMRELPEQLDPHKFNCKALIPGGEFDQEEIDDFKKKYKLPFEVEKDLTKRHLSLNATITPEVFVINERGEVLYHGRIDDSYLRIGKKRTIIKEHNLDNALTEINAGMPVTVPFVPAVGCIIEKN
ncbi:MAG: redoxin domain-containing protein [Flavobacteriales bacterium]|nr:redoxin domain-containing protein [Flavobacteriales bacterium]